MNLDFPIQSILDNDLYKFTMQQAVLQLFPKEVVRYSFIARDDISYKDGFESFLIDRIRGMADFRLSTNEQEFIRRQCYYFTPVYLDFLRSYKYNPDEVYVYIQNGRLNVEINGFWYRTILWEVPLLAIISQCYYEYHNIKPIETIATIRKRNAQKANNLLKLNCFYSEFGTRRRYSFVNQKMLVEDLLTYGGDNFLGTSNLFLAFQYNLKAMGTQAHEWYMFHAAKYGYPMATKMALDNWIYVYQGELGIALTDTFTTPEFLKQFGTYYAKLFDGVRQDSGDPIKWTDMIYSHYLNHRILPNSKTILYSDALNFDKIHAIKKYLKKRKMEVNDRYGPGTWFSNDLKGVIPRNMVIKLARANSTATVKLSDTESKHTGEDPEEINLCMRNALKSH